MSYVTTGKNIHLFKMEILSDLLNRQTDTIVYGNLS